MRSMIHFSNRSLKRANGSPVKHVIAIQDEDNALKCVICGLLSISFVDQRRN